MMLAIVLTREETEKIEQEDVDTHDAVFRLYAKCNQNCAVLGRDEDGRLYDVDWTP